MDTHTIFFNCFKCLENFIKTLGRGFPGGSVVKNPPANAGDMGWIPGSREIPQATEQLSPCTTTTEPVLQSPCITVTEACEPRAQATREATIMRTPDTATGEQPPFAATREKPTRSNKDPAQPKTKKSDRSQVISLPLLQDQSSSDCHYVSQYCPGKILISNS